MQLGATVMRTCGSDDTTLPIVVNQIVQPRHSNDTGLASIEGCVNMKLDSIVPFQKVI